MSKTIILLALLACSGLHAQTVADPSRPGPSSVAFAEYKFTNVLLPSVAYPVDIWGAVWYPDGLRAGPYPLVVLLHGNHGICRRPGTKVDQVPVNPPNCPAGFEQTPNHLGYSYIAERLAGWGYVVVSINANAINGRPAGLAERGRLVQEHLRYWQVWNSSQGARPFDTTFSGKLNLQKIGLMGHSRGGEGVRAAYNFNRQEGSPFGIQGVLELAPTDAGRFGGTAPTPLFNVDNVNWSVVLPGCDDDVIDNQGMQVFDRARGILESRLRSPKSQQYVWGPNHEFFNTEWDALDPFFQCIEFPIITARPAQEQIGLVYFTGFFRAYLGGDDFKSLFTGDARLTDLIPYPVDQSYSESPNAVLLIDNFGGEDAPAVNSAGGKNTATNLQFDICSFDECNDPPPGSWFHDPALFTSRVAWQTRAGAATPSLTMEAGRDGAAVNASTYAFLAFRVAQQFDPRNAYNPASQNFSIRVTDVTGANSTAVAATSYRNIPFPIGYSFRRSVLKTIRIPLADFRGVDLRRLASIQFLFDKQPAGALFLTDVQFTP